MGLIIHSIRKWLCDHEWQDYYNADGHHAGFQECEKCGDIRVV